jgi:hypothetical protein
MGDEAIPQFEVRVSYLGIASRHRAFNASVRNDGFNLARHCEENGEGFSVGLTKQSPNSKFRLHIGGLLRANAHSALQFAMTVSMVTRSSNYSPDSPVQL